MQLKYRAIKLTDIEIGNLTPVKITLARYGEQDHSRWVFCSAEDGREDVFFYKIWNPSYVRRDNVIVAIDAGFYDEQTVPALYGLIFHKGLCRGYVMHKGVVQRSGSIDKFRQIIHSRTAKTGYFFVQFARCHAMVYEGRWSLLDLEGVYPLELFPRLAEYNCAFEDRTYEKYVTILYREVFSVCAVTADKRAIAASFMWIEFVGNASKFLVEVIVRRLWTWPSRRLARRIRNLVPRIDLIQY